MSKEFLKTKIGLEIHVQLKTKSKMFCSCDNDAEGKEPNTCVCPVCLGQPGSLPVANKQAVMWTIKTGLTLGCEINKISKFDRKHYFYPDLPKGYQISQYDEPFCLGGFVEVGGHKIRLNRIHLEEDAGKLVHREGKSLVDLNRAGTPLMEIVTEPDLGSPEEAGEFLRKLQKIVRDVAAVSEASMEKGHLRCDANISVSDDKGKMSEIVELKNINSFRFIEKALVIEENRIKSDYSEWPSGKRKVTRGYDSKKNQTFAQRTKEEASDYRYFPEPDLPPFDTSEFDLEAMRAEIGTSEEEKIAKFVEEEKITLAEAKVLSADSQKGKIFYLLKSHFNNSNLLANALVQNYFNFAFSKEDEKTLAEYAAALSELEAGKISKNLFIEVVSLIHSEQISFSEALNQKGGGLLSDEAELLSAIRGIIQKHPNEVAAYRSGKKQLLGFFVGQLMRETQGKADPKLANQLFAKELD